MKSPGALLSLVLRAALGPADAEIAHPAAEIMPGQIALSARLPLARRDIRLREDWPRLSIKVCRAVGAGWGEPLENVISGASLSLKVGVNHARLAQVFPNRCERSADQRWLAHGI